MLLEVENVSKNFGGIKALAGVGFSISKGNIIGIIGPNGAGKTTLLNVITGINHVDNGRIIFQNTDITHKNPYQISHLGIARTFQRVRLLTHLKVLENVMFGQQTKAGYGLLSIFWLLARARNEAFEEEAVRFLQALGLTGKERALVAELPFGEQRIVEIARALCTYPQLLLLDEPTAGMDPGEINLLGHVIRGLTDQGMAIIIISHEVDVVANLCHSVMVLNFGEIIASGSPGEVLRNPRVVEAYLGK